MAKDPGSKEVRKIIGKGEAPPVWLWLGPEEYLKEELFTRLVEALEEPTTEPVTVDRFRAGSDPLDQVLTAAATVPMFAPRRAILVRDIEKVPPGNARKALLAYVASPAPETTLVLTGSKGTKGSALYGQLTRKGVPKAMFWTPFEAQTRRWIVMRFKAAGLDCSPEVAQSLIEACGGGNGTQVPLSDIAPEIEKVILAVGSGTVVREEDLGGIARKASEDLVNQVCASAMKGDLPGALRALDGFLLVKPGSEVYLLARLAGAVGETTWVRSILAAGGSDRQVLAETPVWSKRLPETKAAARRFSAARLEETLGSLAAADRALKSSPLDKRVLVERVLTRLCA